MNPAKLLFDFGARSGGSESLASASGSSVTVVANGSGQLTRLPEVSFGKSVPVSVARSFSSGHLNLSQPAGSCANVGAALTHKASITRRGRMGGPTTEWSRFNGWPGFKHTFCGRRHHARAGLQFLSHNDSRPLCRYWLMAGAPRVGSMIPKSGMLVSRLREAPATTGRSGWSFGGRRQVG
jgi:hypothetical protein